MKKPILAITCVALLVVCAGVVIAYSIEINTPATKTSSKKEYPANLPAPKQLLELVNAERERVGIAPLTIDPYVQRSAQLKADDMAERNYFSHKVKGTDKVITAEMNSLLALSCLSSGENIQATSGGTAQNAFDWWRQSEPHYKAMIDAKYTTTGFGVSFDPEIKQSEIDTSLKRSGSSIKDAHISVQHFCVAK